MKELHASARRIGALLALTATATGFALAPTASAQQPPAAGFSNSMTRPDMSRTAMKYEDANSQSSFVLQRVGPSLALLRFNDSPEVIVLHVTSGPRGDDILRTDSGQVVMKVTAAGNIISYLNSKEGIPADMAGAAGAAFAAPAMPAPLTAIQKDTAARISKLAGHDVTVFGSGEFGGQQAWIADALSNLKLGVERASEFKDNRVKQLKSVTIQRGKVASVGFNNSTGDLTLTVNPDAGYAGRSSSEMIALMLGYLQ